MTLYVVPQIAEGTIKVGFISAYYTEVGCGQGKRWRMNQKEEIFVLELCKFLKGFQNRILYSETVESYTGLLSEKESKISFELET